MYPSYLAAGTLVPAVFNGIPTGGYTAAPNPYTGMQQITEDNPAHSDEERGLSSSDLLPGFPVRLCLGRIRKRKDGHPRRHRAEPAPACRTRS